ncbi:MAG: hypothetical protein U0575_02335 [Phycisphaerales bacterium]|jgi:hypothetical protein
MRIVRSALAAVLLALAGCAAAPPPAPVVPMVFVDGTACSAVPTSASRLLTCAHAVPDVDEGMVILDDGAHAFRVIRRGAPRARFEPAEWLSTDPNAAARVPDLALDWAVLEVDPPIPMTALGQPGEPVRFAFDAALGPGAAVTIRGFLPEPTSDGGSIVERRVDLPSVVVPRPLAGVAPPSSVIVVSTLDLVEADRGGVSGGSVARWITDVDWPTREVEIVGICHGTLVTIDAATNETLFVGCIVVRPPVESLQ